MKLFIQALTGNAVNDTVDRRSHHFCENFINERLIQLNKKLNFHFIFARELNNLKKIYCCI